MIGERRRAAVVAIGDELLAGEHADLNSGVIAAALQELGIETTRLVVLGDDAAALERTFRELCDEHPIVVASGGLGPTLDDVTREAAAAAAGVPLERDEAVLAALRELFLSRGRPFARSNERQAWFPRGAQIMPNARGTAAGFRVWVQGGMLAVLPGPPVEMKAMLEEELRPWLARTCGAGPGLAVARFYLGGMPESVFADQVGDWMARDANPRMGVTAHFGVLRVTLRATAAGAEGARALLEARRAAFRERLGEAIFSESEPRIAFAVGERLVRRRLTLATAESCTGGLLAQQLTDVPGISAVYLEGQVTYANEAKIRRLGVSPALLDRHGAVSAEVAAAMAEGAARSSGARIGLSVTGVAGPEGGTADKPVGLVWFGLCVDGSTRTSDVRLPPLGRESVRMYAAHAALDLLRRNLPPGDGSD